MTEAEYNGPSPYDGQTIIVPDGVIALVFLRENANGDYGAEYAEVRSADVDRDMVADALIAFPETITEKADQ